MVGRGLVPTLGELKKLGRDILGMSFPRLNPEDCCAPAGAARFRVVLTGLKVVDRGRLFRGVGFCPQVDAVNPSPKHSAAQNALRTVNLPSSRG